MDVVGCKEFDRTQEIASRTIYNHEPIKNNIHVIIKMVMVFLLKNYLKRIIYLALYFSLSVGTSAQSKVPSPFQ